MSPGGGVRSGHRGAAFVSWAFPKANARAWEGSRLQGFPFFFLGFCGRLDMMFRSMWPPSISVPEVLTLDGHT